MSSETPKFRPFDLKGIYDLHASPDELEEDIHWSCERFWCTVSFDDCFIRRYTIVEFELEEYDEEY